MERIFKYCLANNSTNINKMEKNTSRLKSLNTQNTTTFDFLNIINELLFVSRNTTLYLHFHSSLKVVDRNDILMCNMKYVVQDSTLFIGVFSFPKVLPLPPPIKLIMIILIFLKILLTVKLNTDNLIKI